MSDDELQEKGGPYGHERGAGNFRSHRDRFVRPSGRVYIAIRPTAHLSQVMSTTVRVTKLPSSLLYRGVGLINRTDDIAGKSFKLG